MEDCRVKYIRSLTNIDKELGTEMDYEDRQNLNICIGYLFQDMSEDGCMTKELAKDLELEYLLKEGE